MKKWVNKYAFYIIGAALGAGAGYLYWLNVGCTSGTCMITSKPVNSTVYGAVMGGLLLSLFDVRHKKVSGNDKNEPL